MQDINSNGKWTPEVQFKRKRKNRTETQGRKKADLRKSNWTKGNLEKRFRFFFYFTDCVKARQPKILAAPATSEQVLWYQQAHINQGFSTLLIGACNTLLPVVQTPSSGQVQWPCHVFECLSLQPVIWFMTYPIMNLQVSSTECSCLPSCFCSSMDKLPCW